MFLKGFPNHGVHQGFSNKGHRLCREAPGAPGQCVHLPRPQVQPIAALGQRELLEVASGTRNQPDLRTGQANTPARPARGFPHTSGNSCLRNPGVDKQLSIESYLSECNTDNTLDEENTTMNMQHTYTLKQLFCQHNY